MTRPSCFHQSKMEIAMTREPPAPMPARGLPFRRRVRAIAASVTLQRIRTVAAIAALASISGAVVILIVLLLSLYPSLRATVHNLERVSAALTVSAENFAGVSDEAAQNLTQTSANLNEASANLKNTTEHFENNLTDDGIAETIIRLLDQASQRDPR